MEPLKARGTGRSGPRRRTGCLTCRARKVRCDESKPTCANCVRVRLNCAYKPIVNITAPRPRNHRPTPSPDPTRLSPRSDLSFFNTVLRPDGQQQQQKPPQQAVADPLRPVHSNPGADFPGGPFDMLGFIGEITSELQQKHSDLTNGASEFASLNSSITLSGVHSFVPSAGPQINVEPAAPLPGDVVPGHPDSDRPAGGAWSEMRATYEEQLSMHFLGSEPPPTIFGPVGLQWKYVKPAMLALSRDFSPLLNAIYCYSDIHKSMLDGKRWKLASMYYRFASSEIESCILGDVAESTLKRVFTTVFLLMLSELLCSPELCRSGTSFIHSAYLLLQRFHSRIKSWSGLGYLVISWISLLDVKSLIAGREGDPLIELGSLSEPVTHQENSASILGRSGRGAAAAGRRDFDSLLSDPGYLVTDAIVGPAFRFFVKAQHIIRRIVCIDLHHRSRGTLSDEFEVLQIAHKVGADLEALWNWRPTVLDVYDRPEELFDTLSQPVALEVCRIFRQYVANFLATFIYLHRVAFAIYPRTDRVNGAVDQIIQLATVESSGMRHLPVSFFWPLFVAGLEGSLAQRLWIVQEMQHMAAADSNAVQRHPNAEKALLLLEEMTRRQDASRTWADSKCVRHELFTDFFVMI
ncbi:C6 finger domain protein [Aspergillus sp. HF37]|nr:C6 finger domain protein [Aspergillus sp. HF37]